jgi:hypothetical protein
LDAIKFTAKWTEEKIHSIHDLMEKVGNRIKTKLPKIYSPELMGVIFSQPYCRIRNFVDGGIAKRQTAAKYIDSLVNCEFYRSTKPRGQRSCISIANSWKSFAAKNDCASSRRYAKPTSDQWPPFIMMLSPPTNIEIGPPFPFAWDGN